MCCHLRPRLGYVWQKQQINSLGQQIKENEIKLEELRRENKRRGDNLAYLMSPRNWTRACGAELGLDGATP